MMSQAEEPVATVSPPQPRQLIKTSPEKLVQHSRTLSEMFGTMGTVLKGEHTADKLNHHSNSFYDEFNKTNDIILQIMASPEWKEVFDVMADRVNTKLPDIHRYYGKLVMSIDSSLIQQQPISRHDGVTDLTVLKESSLELIADLISVYKEHKKKQESILPVTSSSVGRPHTLPSQRSLQSQSSIGSDGEIMPYHVFSKSDLGPPAPRPSNTDGRPHSAHGHNRITPLTEMQNDAAFRPASVAGTIPTGMSDEHRDRVQSYASTGSTDTMEEFVVVEHQNAEPYEVQRPKSKSQSHLSVLSPTSTGLRAVEIPPKLPPKQRTSSAFNVMPPPLPEKTKKKRGTMIQSQSFEGELSSHLFSSATLPHSLPTHSHRPSRVSRSPGSPGSADAPSQPDGHMSLYGNRPHAQFGMPDEQLAQLDSFITRQTPPPSISPTAAQLTSSGQLLPPVPMEGAFVESSASPGSDILGTGLDQRHMSVLGSVRENSALTPQSYHLEEEALLSSQSNTELELESSSEMASGSGQDRHGTSADHREGVVARDRGLGSQRLPRSTCAPPRTREEELQREQDRGQQPLPMMSRSSSSDNLCSSSSESRSPSPPGRSQQVSPRPSFTPQPPLSPSLPPKSPRTGRRALTPGSLTPALMPSPVISRLDSPSPPPMQAPGSPTVPPRRASKRTTMPTPQAIDIHAPPVPSRERRGRESISLSPSTSSSAMPSGHREPLPPPLPVKMKHLSQMSQQERKLVTADHKEEDMDSLYGTVQSFTIAINSQALQPARRRAESERPSSLYCNATVRSPSNASEEPYTRDRTRTVSGRELARKPALPPKKRQSQRYAPARPPPSALSEPPPALPPRPSPSRTASVRVPENTSPLNSLQSHAQPTQSTSSDDLTNANQPHDSGHSLERRLTYSIPPPDIEVPRQPLAEPVVPLLPPAMPSSVSTMDAESNDTTFVDDNDDSIGADATLTLEGGLEEEEDVRSEPLLHVDVYKDFLFTETEDDVKPLRGGTVDTMVSFAASASIEQAGETGKQYVDVFLLTHRPFLPPSDLINKLLKRQAHFQKATTTIGQNSHQQTLFLIMRVVAMLRMRRQGVDGNMLESELTGEVLNNLMKTVYNLICDGQLKFALMLRNQLISKVTARVKLPAAVRLQSETKDMKPIKGSPALALMKYSAKEVAVNVALVDDMFFQDIDPQECLSFSKGQETKKLGTLNRFIDHTNAVCWWFGTQLMELERHKDREKFLKFTLKVCKVLLKLQDFAASVNIFAIMTNTMITRLPFDSRVLERIAKDELQEVALGGSNFKVYREMLRKGMNDPPIIPNLGILLNDLVFANFNTTYLKVDSEEEEEDEKKESKTGGGSGSDAKEKDNQNRSNDTDGKDGKDGRDCKEKGKDKKYINYMKLVRQYTILSLLSNCLKKDFFSVHRSKKNLDIWNIFQGFEDRKDSDYLYDLSYKIHPRGR